MRSQTIGVIGAGIGGLVLARRLLQRGIGKVSLYEKDPLAAAKKRHGYSITLNSSTCRRLLNVLKLDEASFRRALAVDGDLSGRGTADSINVNRQRLEQLLRDGLDIKWEHILTNLKPRTTHGEPVNLSFKDAADAQADLVIGADGAHSQLRKLLSPSSKFSILPYAVYNGKRRVARAVFDKEFLPHLPSAKLSHRHDGGHTLLQISLDDYQPERVSISYTYSRPARGGDDALFTPNRPQSGAQEIPAEFFDEVAAMQRLPPPFGLVFNAPDLRADRLLNWLMRAVLVPREDLDAAAEGSVLLIGDAAHHGPVLGTLGAEQVIEDAVELADFLADGDGSDLKRFYEPRYDGWSKFVVDSQTELSRMHGEGHRSTL